MRLLSVSAWPSIHIRRQCTSSSLILRRRLHLFFLEWKEERKLSPVNGVAVVLSAIRNERPFSWHLHSRIKHPDLLQHIFRDHALMLQMLLVTSLMSSLLDLLWIRSLTSKSLSYTHSTNVALLLAVTKIPLAVMWPMPASALPFRCIIDALTEYLSRQCSTHKTPLCVVPGDPFILCPPYVNSDLWIISFKEEITTSTSHYSISQMRDLTHSPVVYLDYNRNIPPHHIVYNVTYWVILSGKSCFIFIKMHLHIL